MATHDLRPRQIRSPAPLREAFPARLRQATALLCIVSATAAALAATGWDVKLTSASRRALATITPDSLRAHLSFLSADVLQGRGSGSQGLQVAAEYISAQFRRAGLKTVAGDTFFQATPRVRLTANPDGFLCRITADALTLDVSSRRFTLINTTGYIAQPGRELHLDALPIVKVPFDAQALDWAGDVSGKVIITETPDGPANAAEMPAYVSRVHNFMVKIAGLKPVALVQIRRQARDGPDYFSTQFLVDPQEERVATPMPIASVSGSDASRFYEALPERPTGATLSLHLAAPLETSAPQLNVIGLLRGSDQKLSDTYILVTAHYDGQGERPGSSDPIWNSANDNGSGTAAVIEVAAALASLPVRLRRSVVFIAFHEEESGLVGSRYYAEHPVFPLEKTVAAINIEMVGRTDDVNGDQRGRASVTGFDYSDVGEVMQRAGALTGLTVMKHPKNSDSYFGASDNRALAAVGVPAHTVCSTFQFPDYHRANDTWDKIDYENMALTVQTIAAGVLILAQSDREPRWNTALPRTARYLEAWKKRHPEGKH